MSLLYAPWRLEYILSRKGDGCIFCLDGSEKDEEHLIVHRSEFSFVILNMYPYNNGHMMVVPKRHVSRLTDLKQEENQDLFDLVRQTEAVISRVYGPDGINIGLNLGEAAGAGIAAHLHVHVLPRWNGDTNFMTTVGGTRVIPESFDVTWEKLKDQFDRV